MLLVVGGAYSGKRRVVLEQFVKASPYSWISSYQGASIEKVRELKRLNKTLIIEGWEEWLRQDISQVAECDPRHESLAAIRVKYRQLFADLITEENKHGKQVILIMLEMGRGIVPVEADKRVWRDMAGWLLQDAVLEAKEAYYVWNGMVRRMK